MEEETKEKRMFKNAGTNAGHLCKLEIEPPTIGKKMKRSPESWLLWCRCTFILVDVLYIFFNSFAKLSACLLTGFQHSKKLESAIYIV